MDCKDKCPVCDQANDHPHLFCMDELYNAVLQNQAAFGAGLLVLPEEESADGLDQTGGGVSEIKPVGDEGY